MRRKNSAALLTLLAAGVGVAQIQAPPADEKPASVEGEVRNSVSGLQVLRAHVTLRRLDNDLGDKYGALTNAEGKFTIAGIPAGSYTVEVSRVGFVGSGSPLNLQAGERKDDFKAKLVPVGAISGRVLDADGQPAESIRVQAEQEGRGPRRIAVTDDRGQFRLGGLIPGKYRVRAIPQAPSVPPEIRTDGTAEVQYAATWHPGTIAEKGAARVLVGPAGDVTGIDIRLVRTPIMRLSGTVSGLPEGAKDGYLRIMQANRQMGSMARLKPDGSFEVWRLSPGKYTLSAQFNNAGDRWASESVEVEVAEADIDNIGLRVQAPQEIHGQLDFDDELARQAPQAPPPPGSAQGRPLPQPRRIMLNVVKGIGQMYEADVSEDGTFTISKVSPGDYMVRVMGYGACVKSVRIGETVSDGPIVNLSQGSGGAGLTVTLSSAFGEIAGTARDDKGPVAGMRVLLRYSGELRRSLGVFAFPVSGINRTKADGTYHFDSVAPGTYEVQVLDESEGGSYAFDDRAETVEVQPKQTATRDLKVK